MRVGKDGHGRIVDTRRIRVVMACDFRSRGEIGLNKIREIVVLVVETLQNVFIGAIVLRRENGTNCSYSGLSGARVTGKLSIDGTPSCSDGGGCCDIGWIRI
jgi:hypothetical protein